MGNMMTPMTWSRRPAKWLYITAIFELLLAGVFVVVALTVPAAAGGMWLTAGILGVVGLGLLVWASKMSKGLEEADRLREVGLEGTARIVSAEQTGMYMNENPLVEMDLDVTVGGRPPYRVHHKDWIPLIMLGTLSSGLALPVRVDPQDPSKVLIDWTQPLTAAPITMFGNQGVPQPPVIGSAAGIAGAALAGLGLGALGAAVQSGQPVPGVTVNEPVTVNVTAQAAGEQQLLATGIPGQATVSSVVDTGVAVQGKRVMVIDLVVNAGGKPPQTAKHSAMVPEASAAKVVAGATLPVKVNGANPSEFAIDWSAV
jgi:hypothetical protein